MIVLIDNRSGVPIYTQIYSQIKQQIMDGTLKQDEALPSIRNLAKDLRISVITTKRAYEELEKDGYLYTVAGKGCFVSEVDAGAVKEEKLIVIEHLMEQVKDAAASCGITNKELEAMWNTILEEEDK